MSALPDSSYLSEAAYLEQERRSDIKHEYVDGQVVAMSGASPEHITLTTNLIGLLFAALRGQPCQVKSSDLRVRVAATGNYVYPDVTVVCGEPDYMPDEPIATLLNPTLIIEVLSPSTEAYDRGKKFQNYETISTLQDYVLVSQSEPLMECFSRAEGATWIRTKAAGDGAALVLPSLALTLHLNDVYEGIR